MKNPKGIGKEKLKSTYLLNHLILLTIEDLTNGDWRILRFGGILRVG
jgi:hypothetical protein